MEKHHYKKQTPLSIKGPRKRSDRRSVVKVQTVERYLDAVNSARVESIGDEGMRGFRS